MKTSLSLVLLLGALVAVHATRLPSYKQKHKMVELYSSMKLMMGCYGKPTIARWFQKSQEKMADCVQVYKDETKAEAASPDTTAEAAVTGDVFFTAKKVEVLEKKLKKSIKLSRCFLDKFNMTITPEGRVDATYMKDLLLEQVQDAELKQYVISGIEKCERKTGYGEYYKILGADKEEFMKKVKFFRCAKAAKLKACIKYDVNQNKDLFDLTPLADAPAEFDDTKKMLLIVANYATADTTGLFDY